MVSLFRRRKHFKIVSALIIYSMIFSIFPATIPTVTAAPTETYQYVGEWPRLRFSSPGAVAVDGSGNMYVADSSRNKVVKIDPAGNLLVQWGGSGSGDGQFSSPQGITVDPAGDVYVADTYNGRIQKFDSSGAFISKWTGPNLGESQSTSSTTSTAYIYRGIAADNAGHIFATDSRNQLVQKFDLNGAYLSGWGGSGTGDGQLDSPNGIAADSAGDLYVADSGNNRIQKFDNGGVFLAKIGGAGPGWHGSGSGDGEFYSPNGVSVDAAGNVFVGDTYNNRIQKFDVTGAFIAKWGSNGSGHGQFSYPKGVAVGANGNIHVADSGNKRIEKFDSAGAFLATIGGSSPDDGYFSYPNGLAINNYVYVVDAYNHRIQKLDLSGNFITKWGSYGSGNGQFSYAEDIAVDSAGNVYVADSGNNRIQKFDANGVFVAKWGSYGSGNGQFNSPRGVGVDVADNVYVADTNNNRIQKFDATGAFIAKWGSTGSGNGQLYWPGDIELDAAGNVFVADTSNNRIQKFDATGGFLAKIGGAGPGWRGSGSGDGEFNYPRGISIDPAGNIYVADTNNNRVQKFDATGAFITKWGLSGQADGHFSGPRDAAVSASGDVYVTDSYNSRIQQFSLGAPANIAAPANLAATTVSDAQINLTWQDSSTNEEIFVIERKAGAGGVWSQVAMVNANQTSYANTGLTPATTYYYRVKAAAWFADSPWSNEASALTNDPTLAGRVRDASGVPIPGARVLAYRNDIYDPYWNAGQTAIFQADTANNWTYTDQNGNYTLTRQDIDPGSYKLKVLAPGYITEWHSDKTDYGQANTVVLGAASQRVDFLIVPDNTPPSGSVLINGGAADSDFSEVTLNVGAIDNNGLAGMAMRFSNDGLSWTNWEPLQASRTWVLAPGAGTRAVWAQFKDGAGIVSSQVSDDIQVQPLAENINISNGTLQNGERIVNVNAGWRTINISLDVACSANSVQVVVPVNGTPTTVDLVNTAGNHWEATVNNVSNGDIVLIIDCPQEGIIQQRIGRIRLIDPSGYVTDKTTGAPIPGAVVSLYRLNPETGLYGFVDASEGDNSLLMEPDINPQLSQLDGYYGWDVAPGTYYVSVHKDGYLDVDQSRVVVVPPPVIDLNIELTDNRPPTAPVLSGSAAGASRIDLSWTPSVDGESGLAGYRIFDAGSGEPLAETSQTVFSFTGLDAGSTHAYYVRAVDAAGNASDQSNTIAVTTMMATQLTYGGDIAGDYSDIAHLSAVLTDQNGAPIAGKEVKFVLGGQEAAALTDPLGQASADIDLDQPAGLKNLTASYEGDSNYLASQAESQFQVRREEASLIYNGDLIGQRYGTSLLQAQMAEGDASSGDLGGKDITFTITDGLYVQTIGAQTDADGSASATGAIDLPAGIYKVSAAFYGDNYYEATETAGATLVVWEPIAGLSAKGSGKIPKADVKKAEFGFHIKYPNSSQDLKGQFEYEEKLLDAAGKEKEMELESFALNWLVVEGNLAIFDGWAAFEDESAIHTFRVFAYDNGKPGAGADTFELYLDGLPFASGTLIKGDVVLKD